MAKLPVPLEGPRKIVDDIVRAKKLKRSDISTSVLGKNGTYLQQWLKYASPARLPDLERRKLAAYLDIDEGRLLDEAETYEIRDFKKQQKSKGLESEMEKWIHASRQQIFQTRKTAPVVGRTGAGIWMEFENFDREKYEEPVPTVGNEKYEALAQFAFFVTGNSMDRERIFDGDYVICVPYLDVRASPQSGDVVVAERRRGGMFERTCKKVLANTDGSLMLTSRSSDPKFERKPIALESREDDTEIGLIGLVVGTYRPRLV